MQLDLFKVKQTEAVAECPGCGLLVNTWLHAEWFPTHYGIQRASTWNNHTEWRPGDPVDYYQNCDQHGWPQSPE